MKEALTLLQTLAKTKIGEMVTPSDFGVIVPRDQGLDQAADHEGPTLRHPDFSPRLLRGHGFRVQGYRIRECHDPMQDCSNPPHVM
jgi:hypothetical protein